MQTKGRWNVWLFREAKYQPKQPEPGGERGCLHPAPFVHARRMLGRDLQENDVSVHDPIVPDVQFEGRRHEMRFLGEVDGGAVHPLRSPRLIERGDESRQIDGVLVALFESDASAFSPHEHKCQRDEPDEQRKPAPRGDFMNIGRHESEVEQKEQSGDREDQDAGQRHKA